MILKIHRTGFSLIELLVVIAIIAILATLLLPAIGKIRKMGKVSGMQSYLNSVAQAARSYFADNEVYPGQDEVDNLGDYNASTKVTANQVLAACIFGYDLENIDDDAPKAGSNPSYMEYKAEYLASVGERDDGVSPHSAPNTLLDGSGESIVLLYFPSRGKIQNPDGCYVWGDCSSYVLDSLIDVDYNNADDIFYGSHASVNNDLDEYYARDERLGGSSNPVARNQGEFLLFGAGGDGKYFTEDDLKSW